MQLHTPSAQEILPPPSTEASLRNPERLKFLSATGLLDSPPEESFDRLTRMASRILKVPISLVSLVNEDHQFFKSQVGLPEPWASNRETPLSHSFCQHVVASESPLIISDARDHPFLKNNAAVRDLKVIAYLGIPLKTPEGLTLGSFCTIDAHPRVWSEDDIEVMRDLASLVMNEIELRIMARNFQANYLTLRQLEVEREEMVQMLVHDLRNPLSSLLMGLDLMNATEISEDRREALLVAQKGAQSLLRMINDILDISKSEAGRMGLDLEQISIHELIDAAYSLVKEMAVSADVEILIKVAGDVPLFFGDKEKLRRVLVNLISNSVQNTPAKGQVKISVFYNHEIQRIIFEVADTGRGIPKEAFHKIFEKFAQSKLRKEGNASTGLGLPFCKMTVDAHGGEIGVESEEGRGTIFRFEIPQCSRKH